MAGAHAMRGLCRLHPSLALLRPPVRVCAGARELATHATAAGLRGSAAEASAVAGPGTDAGQPRDVVEVLRSRELLQNVTSDELGPLAARERLKVYLGFDPTADSLHVGHLLGIIVLSWFQRCGHEAVALVGGATGSVGDPSGKSAERPQLSREALDANVRGIGAILEDILSRNGEAGAAPVQIVNNLDWWGSMRLLDFLRDVGKHARMGTMLGKDSVRSRLAAGGGSGDDAASTGMSYTEFTYQLLQGYDFVHLLRAEGVRVQAGGSDQWGNITAGTDLTRRLLGDDAPDAFGLTFPLLVDREGRKFGKSEGGAVWLAPARLSPYRFYQYLFKTTDADVARFLRQLTFLPLDAIADIEARMAAGAAGDYRANDAQRLLAAEVTRFVHGDDGLQAALRTTDALQPGSETPLDGAILAELADEAPTVTLARDEVLRPLCEVMVAAGLQKSKGAARSSESGYSIVPGRNMQPTDKNCLSGAKQERFALIKGGGVYKNNCKATDEAAEVEVSDLIDGRLLLLAAGKKNKLLVRVEPPGGE